MDTSRLSQGQMIAAVSGFLLLISLFLKWIGGGSITLTGWETSNGMDIYLFILGLIAIAPAAMEMGGGGGDLPYLTTESKVLTAVIGLILVAYYFLFDIPEGADRKFGLWLALLAVIGIVVGQFQAMNQEAGRY